MKAQLTPTSNFILPLLHALESVGGSGKKIDIYRMLEKKMDLSSADMEMLNGYHRYHRPLNYLVGDMRKAGLLEPGAGDNSLRITATGLRLIGK
jgi:Mrr N-terminal domain